MPGSWEDEADEDSSLVALFADYCLLRKLVPTMDGRCGSYTLELMFKEGSSEDNDE